MIDEEPAEATAARGAIAGGWVDFDVLARNAAAGAHAAMALRAALPEAIILSEPDRRPAWERAGLHLLHCRAFMLGSSVADTRAALEEAVERVCGSAPQSRARVSFRD